MDTKGMIDMPRILGISHITVTPVVTPSRTQREA